MPNNNNKDKNTHGKKGKESLDAMLEALKDREYIVEYRKDYRIADPEYKEKQFYFQFIIEFRDEEEWILQHTTSIRDRIVQQQWNSEHIKRLNDYVKKAYVVVPDGLEKKEKQTAERYNKKITDKKIYSALDGVLPFEELYRLIEHKAAGLMKAGQGRAILGLHFEDKLTTALNSKENLTLWQGRSSTDVGYLFSLFEDVMKTLGLKAEDIKELNATTKIPKLDSGGSPKTDVLLTITHKDGGETKHTFSCKRSSAKKVSVHEYSAEAFSKVLNPEDKELKTLLEAFQKAGGEKALGNSKAKELERCLAPYQKKLNEWVLAGIGGEGDPEVQWAEFIVVVKEDKNEYEIMGIHDYINKCEEKGVTGQFGSMFNWTYPSKKKGKKIQLKMSI